MKFLFLIEGGNGWQNVWKDEGFQGCTLVELADKREEYLKRRDAISHDLSFDSMWMQFFVDWAGSNMHFNLRKRRICLQINY